MWQSGADKVTERGALSGIRVLDTSQALAAPTAAAILADLGAEVIKVETQTKLKDRIRTALLIAIFPENEPSDECYWEENGFFLNTHRNKLGITLNLKKLAGVEILKRLAAQSDVLIENNRPGVMARLGLSRDVLLAVNPRLVILSNTGFGQSGPWRNYPGLASMMEGLTGLAHASGYEDGDPARVGNGYFDYMSGWSAAIAILAALHYRRRSGRGQYIDQSMFQIAMHAVAEPLLEYQLHGTVTPRMGNRHRSMVPHGVFRCLGEDRWVAIAVRSDDDWRNLCDQMGEQACPGDIAALDALGRRERREEIEACIAAWTQVREAGEVMSQLQAVGVPTGVVQSAKEVLCDPQLLARDAWQMVRHPAVSRVGDRPMMRAPFVLSATPVSIRRPSPTLGQHNVEIFQELLGLSEAELMALTADGVISKVPAPEFLDPKPDEILPLNAQKEAGIISAYDEDYREFLARTIGPDRSLCLRDPCGTSAHRVRTACPYVFPGSPVPGRLHRMPSGHSRAEQHTGTHRSSYRGTNAIESTNYQLRKIIKNRGHVPDDDAAIKLLYLGIRNITGRRINGDGLTLLRGERGTGTLGWKRALAVRFGDRLAV